MSGDSRISFSTLGARLRPPMVTALMSAALENPRVLSPAAGFTDTTTLPLREVGQAVAELAALGVRRLSLGGRPARVALGAFLRAAREIATEGTFEGLADDEPSAELNRFFRDWTPRA